MPTGIPVHLGFSSNPLTVMMVFGVGWECVKNYVDPQMAEATHLSKFGHQVSFIEVETLSSSARNAGLIREAVMAESDPEAGRRLVLLGYSKGTPDILEAISAFPDLQKRVAAVVSVAGAVGGSPCGLSPKLIWLDEFFNERRFDTRCMQTGLLQQVNLPEILLCAGVKRRAKPFEHVFLCQAP